MLVSLNANDDVFEVTCRPEIFEIYRADDPDGQYSGMVGEIIEKENGMFEVNVPTLDRMEFGSVDDAKNYVKSNTDFGSLAKYQDYTLPGGENYREILFKTPQRDVPATINEKFPYRIRKMDKDGNTHGFSYAADLDEVASGMLVAESSSAPSLAENRKHRSLQSTACVTLCLNRPRSTVYERSQRWYAICLSRPAIRPPVDPDLRRGAGGSHHQRRLARPRAPLARHGGRTDGS